MNSGRIIIGGLAELGRGSEYEKKNREQHISELRFWCDRILTRVRQTTAETLVMEISANPGENPQLNLSYVPELADLLVQTIRNFLNEMPKNVRVFFANVSEKIESNNKGH